MIIAVSGTPGTGKTTVAKMLAEKIGYKYVSLNELAKKEGLYAGYDERRRCEIVDVEKISEKVKKMKNAVVESHYAHEVFSDALIILSCDIKELRKRLEKRGWRKEKIDENVEAEIFKVCASEASEAGKAFIDADATGSAESVVKEIIGKLGLSSDKRPQEERSEKHRKHD